MNRCLSCRRPLKSPESIASGMGPSCLRKSVQASAGPDLFAQARKVAIVTLKAAADECAALGVVIELRIEGEV